MGLSSTTKTALLAEVYGTDNLGGIRAMSTTVMVFSTALSPALFGFFLDNGFQCTSITAGAACGVLLVMFLSGRLPNILKASEEATDAQMQPSI